MLDCKETVARLQTFVDRELSEVEVREVRMHLERCPPCLGHFRFEEGLRRLVQQRACPEKAPDALRDRLARQLRDE